jgi:hypothetical protein
MPQPVTSIASAALSPALPQMREDSTPDDPRAVRDLTASTGFFSDEEIAVAVELIEARLAQGLASGYRFIFAERAGRLEGYVCFGPIPLTRRAGRHRHVCGDLDTAAIPADPRLLPPPRLQAGGGAARLLPAGGRPGDLCQTARFAMMYCRPTRASFDKLRMRKIFMARRNSLILSWSKDARS